MTNYFIIPGLGNSGPGHWQTYFEQSGSNFYRIEQQEWDAPNCQDWIETIERNLQQFDPATVVLIAHSMGCTAVAHWAKVYQRRIKGALLVAPSDLEQPAYTFPSEGFTPIPLDQLNFKTIVVNSSDDIWVTPDRARFFAEHWGSEYIELKNAGHINVAAGYGNWDAGLELLKKFD